MTDTPAAAEDVASALIDLVTSSNLGPAARDAVLSGLNPAGSGAAEVTSVLLRETQEAIDQAGSDGRYLAVASAYKRWIRYVGDLVDSGTLSPGQAAELADALRRIGRGTAGPARGGLYGSSLAGADEDDDGEDLSP